MRTSRGGRTKRITLLDVAKDAGVSRATASLVMRGSPLVSPKTRQAVLDSMRRLGYVYHRAAASLRTDRSQTIALVVTDITNPFFAELTVSIEAAVGEQGYAVLLSNTSDSFSKQERLLGTIIQYPIDGIVLCPAKGTPPSVVEELCQRLPVVLVTRYFDVDVDYVVPDNRRGADMAVSYLLDHGHRRIAFVGGPVDSSARRDRLQGYFDALNRYGLPVDEALLPTSPVSRDGGYQAILSLLQLPQPPTAVLAYNDIVALGVMLGLQASGLRPGEDVAVIGFDDIADAALAKPALTTIAIPPSQIGREAARVLLERLADRSRPCQRIILPPKLIVRESCCRRPEPLPTTVGDEQEYPLVLNRQQNM